MSKCQQVTRAAACPATDKSTSSAPAAISHRFHLSAGVTNVSERAQERMLTNNCGSASVIALCTLIWSEPFGLDTWRCGIGQVSWT